MSHRRYFLLLTTLFFVEFLLLAIHPHDRADWALENVLVLVFVIILAVSHNRLVLSRLSYTFIFIFMCFHQVGAHYTYARVPYDVFFIQQFDFSLNESMDWSRNHFDRLVHFLFGLLMAYPIREVYVRLAYGRGFWGYFFPLLFTIAASMIFELFEWAAAETFGGDLGMAYLGTQGDVWDSHKDSLMASIGALVTMLITMGINMSLQKNFMAEWKQSLRVKGRRPLGEDEIARLLEKRDKK